MLARLVREEEMAKSLQNNFPTAACSSSSYSDSFYYFILGDYFKIHFRRSNATSYGDLALVHR